MNRVSYYLIVNMKENEKDSEGGMRDEKGV